MLARCLRCERLMMADHEGQPCQDCSVDDRITIVQIIVIMVFMLPWFIGVGKLFRWLVGVQ